MHTPIRTLAMAAALAAAAPIAAQATAITLDFEGQNGAVLAVSQPYTGNLLVFSDDLTSVTPATAFLWTSAFAVLLPAPPVGPTFAYGNVFSIAIDSGMTETCTPATAGARLSCFNQLALHYFSSGGSITIWDDSAAGASQTIGLSNTSGSGSPAWAELIDPATNLPGYSAPGRITRIDFSGGGTNAIYIDDVALSFSGAAPGPGALPEPASFALVLLALAAAGMTGRRRAG